MDIVLTNEQQVVVHLNPVSAKGKVEKLFGVPSWTVVSGDSTITPAADGLSCTIVSSDVDGATVISVQAEGDATPGTDTISDTINVTVVDPEASKLGLAADAPTLKP